MKDRSLSFTLMMSIALSSFTPALNAAASPALKAVLHKKYIQKKQLTPEEQAYLKKAGKIAIVSALAALGIAIIGGVAYKYSKGSETHAPIATAPIATPPFSYPAQTESPDLDSACFYERLIPGVGHWVVDNLTIDQANNRVNYTLTDINTNNVYKMEQSIDQWYKSGFTHPSGPMTWNCKKIGK